MLSRKKWVYLPDCDTFQQNEIESYCLNFARVLTGNVKACISLGSNRRSLLEKIQVLFHHSIILRLRRMSKSNQVLKV